MTLPEFIATFCYKREDLAPGVVRWHGTCGSMGAGLIRRCLPEGFREVREWGFPATGELRAVWIADVEWSTITYCEGDVLVVEHEAEESFREELRLAEEFYVQQQG